MKRVTALIAMGLIFAAVGVREVCAQDSTYPLRPVRVIVPFPPGQATDIIGRLVAQKLTEKWGRPVVVENRPGAGGNIGVEVAAKSVADGYTLLVAGSGPMSISPALHPQLAYKPTKDFAALALVASMPMILVTDPAYPAKSVGELLALLRAKPGEIPYGSSGTGTTGQLAAELFLKLTNTRMNHIPYKGSGAVLNDVIGGRVPVTVESQAACMALIISGKLRPIAVTSAKRSSMFLDVPTLAESGLTGFDVSAWIGVLAPVGVPAPILKKISEDLAQIVEAKDLQSRVRELGLEPAPMGAERFSAHIQQEIDKYQSIVTSANIRAD